MPVIIDGTNGVSTPNTFAFKNRLINSQLLINQRGVSGTVSLSAGAYGHDRFKAGSSGCTYTFSTSNNVTTLTITAGSLQQVVEGLNLESGTYTLSWTGTAQGKIGAGSYSASGITGSITGGTNTTIEFNTGTLSLPQLEKGSTATSFDYRPYGTELELCQRYYWKWVPQYASSYICTGLNIGTANTYGSVTLPVTMRTMPTLGTSGTASDYGGYTSTSRKVYTAVPSIDTNNTDTPLLYFAMGATITSGDASINGSNTTNGFLSFSAEL